MKDDGLRFGKSLGSFVENNSKNNSNNLKPSKMKNQKQNLFFITGLCLFIVFVGCKKGDNGINGTNGATGSTGATGTTGGTGNANVHSRLFTISSWSPNDIFNPSEWNTTLVDTDITQSIVDSGAVIVYYKSSGYWNTLPYAELVFATVTHDFAYKYKTDSLFIKATSSNLSFPSSPGTRNFKIVTIAASAALAHLHVNWNDYEEVQQTFNLSN